MVLGDPCGRVTTHRLRTTALDYGYRLTDEGRHWPDLPAAFLFFDGHSVLQKWRRKVTRPSKPFF